MKRDDITVPVACGMDFEAMRTDGADALKRFCGDCKKHVHDLSSMSKDDARGLLSSCETEGLCVRYLYDAEGNVVFANELAAKPKLVSTNALSRFARARRFVAAAATLALPMTLNACMGAYQPPPPKAVPAQVPTQVGTTTIEPQVDAQPRAVDVVDGGAAPASPTSTPLAK